MEIKGTESVKINAEVIRTKQVARRAPQALKRQAAAAAKTVTDRVDVRPENVSNEGYTAKYYDYTVNSDHDLVVKVRDLETRDEIRQIPSKEVQSFKRAYNKVVARFFDAKV
ncbi:MAG: hypothetical protein IEMM0002_0551 [bacterium]|nr:MAG: hypothetical protein IEMM0002_0551 [bacterium]